MGEQPAGHPGAPQQDDGADSTAPSRPCDCQMTFEDSAEAGCTHQLILQSTTDLMWRNDAQGKVAWISPSVTDQLGWTPTLLVGTSLLDIIHPEDRTTAESGKAAARSGVASRRNLRVATVDGRWVAVSLHAGPIRDRAGRVVGTFGTAHDRSAERAAEQARAETAERFRRLVELNDRLSTADTAQAVAEEGTALLAALPGTAAVAALRKDDDSLVVVAADHNDPATAEVSGTLGLTLTSGPGEPATLRAALAHIGSVLETTLEVEGRVLGSIAVVRGPDGEDFEEPDRELAAEVADRIARAVEARRLARILRDSEEQMRLAMENAPIGMALVGLDGRFLRVNPALCDLLGYETVALEELTFQDVTHPEDLAADMQNVEDLLAGRIPAYRMEKRYLTRDGAHRWCLLAVSLVRDPDGQPLHFISQVMDVSEARMQRERLSYEVTHDPLTGLLNRAGLAEEMEHHHGTRSTLLFCDLDNFKELNDNLGHAAGDFALRAVAERLSARLRDSDSIARLGGDEFVVLLRHHTSTAAPEVVAEELRTAVGRPIALGGGVTWRLTLSIGASPTGLLDPSAAMEMADGALRQAKRDGRDRVVYGDTPPDRQGAPPPDQAGDGSTEVSAS